LVADELAIKKALLKAMLRQLKPRRALGPFMEAAWGLGIHVHKANAGVAVALVVGRHARLCASPMVPPHL
jgi:hypothetical protein